MPPQTLKRTQPPSALVAQTIVGTACSRIEADRFLASLVLDGTARAWLPGRVVEDHQCSRLRMCFLRDRGWIAPRMEVVGAGVCVPQRVCVDAWASNTWQLPPKQEGEPLEIDAEPVQRAIDAAVRRNAPPAEPRRRPGPRGFDGWEQTLLEFATCVIDNGVPRQGDVAALIRHLTEWGDANYQDFPAERTVRAKVDAWLKRIRARIDVR